MTAPNRHDKKPTCERESRSGSLFPTFALLLAGSALLSLACSSGSSSPTEPSLDPASIQVTGSDGGTSGSSSEAEVDGAVAGVDVGGQTIDLVTGDRVIVDQNTLWDPRGDLFSFDQLVSAFNANRNVRVEADGTFTQGGSVLAATIKAETDEGPNDDANDDGPLDDDSDADTDNVDSDDSDAGDDSDDSDAEDSDSEDSDGADSDDGGSGDSGQG